jgi:hypothetical protein
VTEFHIEVENIIVIFSDQLEILRYVPVGEFCLHTERSHAGSFYECNSFFIYMELLFTLFIVSLIMVLVDLTVYLSFAVGLAVALFVVALYYTPEGCGFDCR